MDSVDKTLELFYSEVPILKLFGTPHLVEPDVPYDVDSDVQLVCKYLRAYKTNNINRLHHDRNPPVKFSLDNDLSAEECHSFLKAYMPDHIACSKITQHLFIRWC